MGRVIDIKDYLNETRQQIPLPTKQEIDYVNDIVQKITARNKDQVLDFRLWNGAYWETMFHIFEVTKPELDPWDVLAVFLMKTNGTIFESNEDGTIVGMVLPSIESED